MMKDTKFYDHEIKTLFGFQLLASLIYLLILKLFDAANPTLLAGLHGCALMSINSIILMWALRNIFLKKLIAFSVALVVFKTSVFLVLVYYFKAETHSESLAFMFGVAIATLSLGLVGFRKQNGSF